MTGLIVIAAVVVAWGAVLAMMWTLYWHRPRKAVKRAQEAEEAAFWARLREEGNT